MDDVRGWVDMCCEGSMVCQSQRRFIHTFSPYNIPWGSSYGGIDGHHIHN